MTITKQLIFYRIPRALYHRVMRTLNKGTSMFTDKFPRKFICKPESRLIYLNNPKVACSSIKASMFMDFENYEDIHTYVDRYYTSGKLSSEQKSYYKFTFVRNPYVRLVSCYEDKVLKNRCLIFKEYYSNAYLSEIRDFDDFIKWIIKVPYNEAEPHFASQYHLIYNRWGKCLVDFVGKMENLINEYEPIRERFDLNPLPYKNRVASLLNKDWKDYYTLETAELVYKKYKKDFITFGYKDEYESLKKYLREK